MRIYTPSAQNLADSADGGALLHVKTQWQSPLKMNAAR